VPNQFGMDTPLAMAEISQILRAGMFHQEALPPGKP